MWRRANEKRCGRAVLAIGRRNGRRDAVMRAGVTPAEVHANNATGPRQVTSNQTPVIVTRQTGNMHTNAVGPSVSISPDATKPPSLAASFTNRHKTALACSPTSQSNDTNSSHFFSYYVVGTPIRGHVKL